MAFNKIYVEGDKTVRVTQQGTFFVVECVLSNRPITRQAYVQKEDAVKFAEAWIGHGNNQLLQE